MKCLLRIHGLERLPNVQKQKKNACAKRAKVFLSLLKRQICDVFVVVVDTEAPWHQLQRNKRKSLRYAAKDIIAFCTLRLECYQLSFFYCQVTFKLFAFSIYRLVSPVD